MRISAGGGERDRRTSHALQHEGSVSPSGPGGLPPANVADRQGCQTLWKLYHTNREAWAAAKELLLQAQASIAIEQYIFSHHGIGKEVLDILARKARQGMRVRVLADAFGSQHLLKSEEAKVLTAAGGQVITFNGIREFLKDPTSLFHRLHRKSIVCDGRYLMTGGSCFHPRMEDWRDTMVLIEGPVANQALAQFEATWDRAGGSAGTRIADGGWASIDTGDWSYMVSSPYGLREYYLELLKRIDGAQRVVTLTSPYLVPVGRFWTTMAHAVRRGVQVRVLIPKRSDQPLIDIFSLNFARRLLNHGIEVYGFARGMMHAKLAVIDDNWAAVGSFNLGIDSIRMNLEGVLVSVAPDFHAALAEQLEADLRASRRL
jgi:cardiolipin synthase